MTGFTTYNGIIVQQHNNYATPFIKLLKNIKPARILEIGTGAGGFTLFLRNTLNQIDLKNTYIKSFDINNTILDENDWDLTNLELIKDNLFTGDNNFILSRYELIEPYIKSDGVTIVLCDGGHKINEFNQIAPLLKIGDIIMAHDYVENEEKYKNEFLNKIWNWCEIQEKDIEHVCKKENLKDFMKEEFNEIVWVCKQKI